jgi:hypothetical protein
MFGRPERDLQRAPDAVQRCAFHSRFDLRGRVDVHCDRGRGQVRLDGDDSAFLDHEDLDPSTRQDVLTTLAVLRLEGLQRHRRQELAATADLGD